MGRQLVHWHDFPVTSYYHGIAGTCKLSDFCKAETRHLTLAEVRSFDLPQELHHFEKVFFFYVESSLGNAQPSIPIPSASCLVLPANVSHFTEWGTNRVLFKTWSTGEVTELPPDLLWRVSTPSKDLPLFGDGWRLLSDPYPWQNEINKPAPQERESEDLNPSGEMDTGVTAAKAVLQDGTQRTALESPGLGPVSVGGDSMSVYGLNIDDQSIAEGPENGLNAPGSGKTSARLDESPAMTRRTEARKSADDVTDIV